ncbi:unnamed protein product [Cuscuta epithymum]|uniref:Uncharacterized protein n=1 Tax=Cuscuta epithymum TaxID=186058 RepID=A0AAV0FMG8_9ASTE|nr:unnamed protein product [Cuscuta epithymum]
MPPQKRKKKGAAEKKDAPVIVVEERSPSRSPVVAPPPSPRPHVSEEPNIVEIVQFPIKAGDRRMRDTLHPVGFLRCVMSSTEKTVLAQMEDAILDYQVASYSSMATLAASEQARRAEQLRIAKAHSDEALKKFDNENASLRRKLDEAEKTLRLEKEAFQKILENNKVVAKAEGRPRLRDLLPRLLKLPLRRPRMPERRRSSKLRKTRFPPSSPEGGKLGIISNGCLRWWRLLSMIGLAALVLNGLPGRVRIIMTVVNSSPRS